MRVSQGLAGALLGLLLAAPAAAIELRLASGPVAVLAGVEVPPERAEAAAGALAGLQATLVPERAPATDRHGRLRAQLRSPRGDWAQAALVRAGLAVVAPAEDVAPSALRELLDVEGAARRGGVGLWQGGLVGPWPADAVPAGVPRYLVVAGRPQAVARARGFVYVNFGRRWREDFTVRAEERVARRLAKEGLDLAALVGRRVEVRGMVFDEDGPMIELVHPLQLVPLP